MDTIVAAATPLSEAGAVGVIRISGDSALAIAEKLFSAKNLDFKTIEPNKMYLGTLTAEKFSDKAFCLYCRAPKSYTGEDVVEFQVHGGTALVRGVVREIVKCGARPAGAGEFTRRAYENGKLDLAEAEGIADIINADSEAAVMQAFRLMSGEISKGIAEAEELILSAASGLEAALDYPEELLEDTRAPAKEALQKAYSILSALYQSSRYARMINEGASVVLVGLANVGKSSLMNLLLGDERAIVTEIAGTTRDVLRESLSLDGVKINLADTAGIRESADAVEGIGIARARRAAEGADLVLFVMDESERETEGERELFKSLEGKKVVRVANKNDLSLYPRRADVFTRANTGEGKEELLSLIKEKLGFAAFSGSAALTRERHIFAVGKALEALESALSNYEQTTPDCALVDIKRAYKSLLSLRGGDVADNIADAVFARFCVGK